MRPSTVPVVVFSIVVHCGWEDLGVGSYAYFLHREAPRRLVEEEL
jgi:hypothetical protein